MKALFILFKIYLSGKSCNDKFLGDLPVPLFLPCLACEELPEAVSPNHYPAGSTENK